jgi:acyl-CoA synthetase (AMP-forming)/AMP-acid ligase II
MYGATETQGITVVHWITERVGLIGLPLPGVTLKLVPNGQKLEVRVKGSTVTPGYLTRPDLTEAAFDEEGFYKLGDAAKVRRSRTSRQRASSSTAASPRTSSCRAAPGYRSARCVRTSSPPSRH